MHLLEWPKSRTCTTANADENVEQELSRLVGVLNGTTSLEYSLAVSYKMKPTLTTRYSNHAPWYIAHGYLWQLYS